MVSIIYAENLDDIPPSDIDRALSLPYDTDIGEGKDGEIPDDPEEAMKANVMKLTKFNALAQINKMTKMVKDLGRLVVTNLVPGEEIKTSSSAGIHMLMTR